MPTISFVDETGSITEEEIFGRQVEFGVADEMPWDAPQPITAREAIAREAIRQQTSRPTATEMLIRAREELARNREQSNARFEPISFRSAFADEVFGSPKKSSIPDNEDCFSYEHFMSKGKK